ncbi:MAG: type II toxin-antitoxin system Phd/YefM family antitoxin [Actinomycetota bacterium]
MDEMAITQFKAQCLAAIERVRRTGRPLLVTKRGKPVAQVVPPPTPVKKRAKAGYAKGTIEILGDIVGPTTDISEWSVH